MIKRITTLLIYLLIPSFLYAGGEHGGILQVNTKKSLSAAVEFTQQEKDKLSGIEPRATAGTGLSTSDVTALITAAGMFKNTLYPDPAAADQGAAGSNTVKSLIDAMGSSEKATLVFRHNGASNTTTYTFATDENITENITVIMEPGAVLADSGNVQLSILGTFIAVREQCFDWDGTSYIYFGANAQGNIHRTTTVYPEWWGAKTDTTTSCNVAIEKAAISFRNLGGIIQFGPGVYKLTGTITADQPGVTYQGVGWSATMWEAARSAADLDGGTYFWIESTGIKVFAISAFGVRLKQFGMAWLQPAPGSGWSPTEYDYAIQLNNGSDNIVMEDLFLMNATYGIRLGINASNDSVGRVAINRIYGNCFKVGIALDYVNDFSSFENIHFVHYWSSNTYVTNYMLENFKVFTAQHIDQPQFNNIRAFYAYVGFSFDQRTNGNGCGGVTINNVTFDWVAYGLVVNSGAVANGRINNFGHFGLGRTITSAWATSTYYGAGSHIRVTNGGNVYSCVTAHTSGVFADDLAAGKWDQLNTTGYAIYDAGGGQFDVNNFGTTVLDAEGILLGNNAGSVYHIDNIRVAYYNGIAGVGCAATNCGPDNTMYIGSQRRATNAGANAATSPNIWGGDGTILKDGEGLGAYSVIDLDTVYQAATDLFLHVKLQTSGAGDSGKWQIAIDTANPPVQEYDRCSLHHNNGIEYAGMHAAVKRGYYYEIQTVASAGTPGGSGRIIPVSHWKHDYN